MRPLSKSLAVAAALVVAGYLAICALLYLLQDRFIYYPVPRGVDTPAITLQRGDADVVVSTNGVESDHAIVYFGGNAEDVSRAIAPLGRAFPGARIYAMHYRGYGGSTGTPSEPVLVADGIALLHRVRDTHSRISIVGRSLGSGVAVQVAASSPVERLVLVTPFNSIAELVAGPFKLFPTHLLLRDKYESWRHVQRLQVPTTIIVAANDQVVPTWSSRKLADAFPAGVAKLVVIPDAGHNTVSDAAGYATALGSSD